MRPMKTVKPDDLFKDAQEVDMSGILPSQHAGDWAAFYKEALDEAAIVAMTAPDGTIISVNQKFCEISGYREHELIGANHRLLQSGMHDHAFWRDFYQTITRGLVWHGKICNRAKSGHHYWVDTTVVPHKDANGRIHSYTAIRFDITPQKVAEERLWKLANTDPLTGLPNRRCFLENLQALTDTGAENGIILGLMDIDNFKGLNDSLGHTVGDHILQHVATRIREALNDEDIVARLGGDEFALILRHCASNTEAEERIARIEDALSELIPLGRDSRRVSASLGLTRFPEGGATANELVKHADIALYKAKANGRNRTEFFTDSMREEVTRHTELLHRFETALLNHELEVHYQPAMPLTPQAPFKMEALVRWRHPEQGLLYPPQFMDALLDERLATMADFHVLETVLRDIRRFHADGAKPQMVTINATTGDFRSPHFIARILTAIEDGEIAPANLCVEITEGMILDDRGSMARSGIEKLHAYGVLIAFDDFGTGYASLRDLHDLPVDFIKIDKSFIVSLATDAANRAIVQTVIELAHHLGKRVVAEGVDDAAKLAILREFGCDSIQGFLISPAQPYDTIRQFLLDGRADELRI